jgi:hypothetical protein
VGDWHSTEWFPILTAGQRYVISLKGFLLRIHPNCCRTLVWLKISHELCDANFKGGSTMQWSKVPKAGLFVIGLSVAALFSAPDQARAATSEADAFRQAGRIIIETPFGPAVQQSLPAGPLGAGSSVLTTDPLLKLAHCCHAHPVAPYDSHCCHPATTVYVAPVYGYGAAGVRGVSRRTSRRVSRRR